MPAKPNPRPDALRDLTPALDAQTRARLNAVVNHVLDDVERRLLIGDPGEVKLLLSAIMPGLLRQATNVKGDDGDLRAEFENVMAAVRGQAHPAP